MRRPRPGPSKSGSLLARFHVGFGPKGPFILTLRRTLCHSRLKPTLGPGWACDELVMFPVLLRGKELFLVDLGENGGKHAGIEPFLKKHKNQWK